MSFASLGSVKYSSVSSCLSGTYSFAVSFCLPFCVHGSIGCRTVVPLDSGVCPLVGEVDPETCASFLVGGPGAFPLVGGAGSCSSGGQGHVKLCV